jgi:hypothetical protein
MQDRQHVESEATPVAPVAVTRDVLARVANGGRGAGRALAQNPAAVLALQRRAGNRATTRTLARYQIEGPWNKGDPVHEVLTLRAVADAIGQIRGSGGTTGALLSGVDISHFPQYGDKGGHNIDIGTTSLTVAQFLRGVFWPDDPQGLLFDNQTDMTNYSSGIQWYSEFSKGEKGEGLQDKNNLIRRSHFGDLQFLHGMATSDNEAASATRNKILVWGKMLIDVAAGVISPGAKLGTIPMAAWMFPTHLDWTVNRLLGYPGANETQGRQRAAGALMHLIQDSHAGGHVQRNAANEIVQFHAYGSQDSDEHGSDDSWGKGNNLREHIQNTGGAAQALSECTTVLVLLDQGAADKAYALLYNFIFKIAGNAQAAGPGKKYEKKPEPEFEGYTPQIGGVGW